MRFYNVAYSGNSYKVRLLLSHLNIPCELIEVDILKGELHPGVSQDQPQRPHARARRQRFCPRRIERDSRLSRARHQVSTREREKFGLVMQWMFFEQYSHEKPISPPHVSGLQHKPDSAGEGGIATPPKREGGWAALEIMEDHLIEDRILRRRSTRSRTSRCSPTRMSPTRVASHWTTSRMSGRGSRASRLSRGLFPWSA